VEVTSGQIRKKIAISNIKHGIATRTIGSYASQVTKFHDLFTV
jgi:hypothetical protein